MFELPLSQARPAGIKSDALLLCLIAIAHYFNLVSMQRCSYCAHTYLSCSNNETTHTPAFSLQTAAASKGIDATAA
jgi:hypothetical protein